MATGESWVEVMPATKAVSDLKPGTKRKRVAAYCRVSTDTEEQLTSYNTQIQYYTDKINANENWECVGIFADEGISGLSTKNRDEFNRMMDLCEKGKIDLIITKSVSRFSRNITVTLDYARKLRERDIGILFEKENIDTLTLTSEMLLALHSIFAQAESESMSENIKLGKRFGYKAGKVGFNFNRVYGYMQDENGEIQVNLEQAVVVQIIFERFLAGTSLREIANELEEQGYKTASGLTRWQVKTIQSILSNEKYVGDVLTQKTYTIDVTSKKMRKNTGQLPQYLIRNHHIPIIDRDRFEAAQVELKRRNCIRKNEKKGSVSKFSGKFALNDLILCGECGSKYRRTIWIKRSGEKEYVWRCVSRLEHGKRQCHHSPSIEDNALKAMVLEAINSVYSNSIGVKDIVKSNLTAMIGKDDASKEIADNQLRLEELNQRMREALCQNASGEITTDELDAICAQIMEETRKIQEDNQKNAMRTKLLTADRTRLNQLLSAIDQMNGALTELDNELVRSVIEKVEIFSKEKIVIWLAGGISYETAVSKVA